MNPYPPPPGGGYGVPPPGFGMPPGPAGYPMGPPTANPLAVVSLVLGLVFCIPGSGIGAIICGFIARSAIAREPMRYTGAGMALAGIILGFGHLLLWILYFVLVVALGVIGAASS